MAMLSQADPSAAAGGAPAGAPAGQPDATQLKNAIREELTDAGVIKAPKKKPEEMFAQLEAKLDAIVKHFNIAVELPTPVEPAAGGEAGGSTAGTMAPGSSGQASSTPLGGGDKSITTGPTKSASYQPVLSEKLKAMIKKF